MTTFGTAKRDSGFVTKPVTVDIPSHEKNECKFRPDLPPDGWRDKVEKSAYGPEYNPPRPAAQEPATDPEATFVPNTVISKKQAKIKEAVPSSRYGEKSIPNLYEARKKNADKIRPRPSFQPQLNEGRLRRSVQIKDSVRSSGYAGSATYRPGPPVRGEIARQTHPELDPTRKYTFQPQLHLSKKAKELRKKVAEKYPQGKRVEQDLWHARPREPRVYSPRKIDSPTHVMTVSRSALSPYADPTESYDTGGFILDSVAFSTRGADVGSAAGFSAGGFRGAHLDVDLHGTGGGVRGRPRARPKTTEYDMHGRPKGEPIFDPSSIQKNRQ